MQENASGDALRISVFHTNDMHGRLEAMARLSSFARRLRSEVESAGQRTFFWDAGDAADRRLRFCSLTKGAAFPQILNAMGYDLQTLGNAISLTYGPQAVPAMVARSDFPVLAANLRDGEGPLVAGLRETVLIPLSAARSMGVIGLTAPWGDFYELFGLHVPDFRAVVRRLVDQLRSLGAGPIIVLSHLGLEDDRRLAEALPTIDLIIGGHSHTRLLQGEECGDVLITQAGQYAECLGRVDLTVEPASGRVVERRAMLFDVPPSEPPDLTVLAAIAAAEQESEILMARPIGRLDAPLSLDHFAECGIGDLAADALRERMGAQAALVCAGLFHAGLPGGTITLGQLDEACFSTANPQVSVVRGEQIVAALERSLDPSFSRRQPPSFRGTPVGLLQVSGMVIEADARPDVGFRIARVTLAGQTLEATRLYRLAHTDAETMPGVGYLLLEEGQETRSEVPTILREAIEDYLHQHDYAPSGRRWIMCPSA